MKLHVKNLISPRGTKAVNQFSIESDSSIAFQSYDSTIAIYDKASNKLTFGCDWEFSVTTLRYLYIWLDDIYGTFEDEFTHSKNKHEYLQKLIDSGRILYDGGLK